jgi:hypothetical protein
MTWTELFHLSSSQRASSQALMQQAMAAVRASTNASLQFSVSSAPASPFAVCLALDAYGVPAPLDLDFRALPQPST